MKLTRSAPQSRIASSVFRRATSREGLRQQLRFELLEGRQLLAADVPELDQSIDLVNGFCRPADQSLVAQASAAAANESTVAVSGLKEGEGSGQDTAPLPIPAGVGWIPMPPPPSNLGDSGNGSGSEQGEFGGSGTGSGGEIGPAGIRLADTFRMHSRPTASKTIYLDFDGFVARGTSWNRSYGIATINSPAYDPAGNGPSFLDSELQDIQEIWHRVAEDFAPFDVNVTTEEPPESDLVNTGSGDERWGIRVVMTVDDWANCGCGGFAYINSFNWGYETQGATDTPTYVFNVEPSTVALAISHEVGHTLGLSHDGTNASHPFQPNAAYYFGHGVGETAWGPIMGAPYFTNVVTWDQGEYIGANNGGANANYNRGPDDLQLITTFNGFGYRTDEAGDQPSDAAEIRYGSSNALDPTLVDVDFFGVISTPTDVDVIRFSTGAGTINLNIESYAGQVWVPNGAGGYDSYVETTRLTPFWDFVQTSNLDIAASIYDTSGNLIAFSNPEGLSAGFTGLTVPAGVYYLVIDGVGFGDPRNSVSPTGYTDYGSLGQYYVTGQLVDVGGPIAVATASDIDFADPNDVIIEVSYADRDGVDLDTLGTGNIAVIGPDGYYEIAEFVGIVSSVTPNQVLATYSVPAPNGLWDSSVNGLYTVFMLANQVADRDGQFSEAGPIGSFVVDVAPTLGPDGFGYLAYPVRYEFRDISETGRFILRGDDEASRLVTPGNGFSFEFYGESYSSLYVSSNGLITFGERNSDYANTDLSDTPSPAAIAVLWDDLFALPNEGVYWQLFGSGDEQQLIVQWETGYFGGNGRVSFQAILSEQGNTIQLNYRDLLANHGQRDDGISATVGVKNQGAPGSELLVVSIDGSGRRYVESGRSLMIADIDFPTTNLSLIGSSVAENSEAGTVVGRFEATDPDPGETFTFELVSGDGDTDNGNFEIVGNELRTATVFDYESSRTQIIRVRSTDSTGNQFEKNFVIDIIDLPEVEVIVVGDGSVQRSRVDQISVTFDGIVQPQDGAFRVTERGTGEDVQLTATAFTNEQGKTTVRLTFSGLMTRGGGALLDGNYQLIIDGAKIVRNGQSLDANGDGRGGDRFVFGDNEADAFFAFFGDSDGNRTQDLVDFNQFRDTYGHSSYSAAYRSDLDFDADGHVNPADFDQIRVRYSQTLDFI